MKILRTHTAGVWLLALLLLASGGCTQEGAREAAPERPADPKAAYWLGRAQQALGAGNYRAALARADSAAHYAPAWAEVAFLQGLVFTRLNRFDRAGAAYEQTLALDPTYRSAWFNLGHNALYQGEYRAALASYRKEQQVLVASSDAADRAALPVVVAQVGRAYALLGVADSARLAYRAALEMDDANAQAHAWLAELYAEEGALAQALGAARRALERAPDDVAYRYLVGALLVRTEQPAAALTYLEAAAAERPWHPGAVYNLGRALTALGRPEEGRRYLEKTDSLQRLNAEIALAQQGTYQYPDNPQRWRLLAGRLRRAGRTDEAQQAANVARTLDPTGDR